MTSRFALILGLCGLSASVLGGLIYQFSGMDWPLWPMIVGGVSVFVALFALAD